MIIESMMPARRTRTNSAEAKLALRKTASNVAFGVARRIAAGIGVLSATRDIANAPWTLPVLTHEATPGFAVIGSGRAHRPRRSVFLFQKIGLPDGSVTPFQALRTWSFTLAGSGT